MAYFHRYFYILLLVFFAFFLSSPHLRSEERPNPPVAKSGVLNLKTWNLKNQGSVALNGEWQFFWNELIAPEKITPSLHKPEATHHNTRYENLPATWNNYTIAEKKLGAHGYATYALTILHNQAGRPMAVRLKEMATAYALFFDGKLISSNGTVGRTKIESVPEYRPTTVRYTPPKDHIQVVLHLSNFDLNKGGPIKEIIIGDVGIISVQDRDRHTFNLLVIGLIFAMGIYHLSLFFLTTKYISPFYFGIFCCMTALRSTLTNDRLLHIFLPALRWETLMKLEFLTFYMGVPVFLLYFTSLFPREFSRRALFLIITLSVLFSGIVIFKSPAAFSQTLTAYQVITVLSGLYVIYVIAQAFKNRRVGTLVILSGFLALFCSALYDILGANYIIQSDFFFQTGLLIFIASQAYLLSLRFSRIINRVEKQKNQLIESHQQFKNSRIALILGLAKLAEYRDEDTGSHLERIREYTKILAVELAKKEKYKKYITEDYINDLYQSSILHDIGKTGISDAILLKPGKLTAEEFEVIKTHVTIGGDTIAAIESSSQVRSFLTLGRDIAYYHHEKWDGTGYPEGLKGEEIPLSARITAVADVYDALTSERPYKKAFSHKKAVQIILEDTGTHFDPDIITAFKTLEHQFKNIRKNFFD